MTVKTEYREYKDCYIVIERYMADGGICIRIWNDADGPIATLTKCLVDGNLGKYDAYIDTNNLPWAMDFIAEYNLGEKTGRYGHSGYCTYPVVRFDYPECCKYVR